ncbi:MAG: hypothetical protein ACFHWX_23190 [Bacteroidota bacterium]
MNGCLKIGFFWVCQMLIRFGYSQDLGAIGKDKYPQLSGGINVNQVLYEAWGIQDRRDPYNYFISGNLNIDFYGWQIPLSFAYSDQNASFQQPFNQYGLRPTYKNLTAHLGYRSMNFSKYSLAGHLFLGGGLEVQVNDHLKVAAMYGRLQKAVQPDTSQVYHSPAFNRMGTGAKITFGTTKDFLDLVFFKAKDDTTSLDNRFLPVEFKPEENLVLSLGFGINLIKGLNIKGEVAGSALTTDIRSEETSSASFLNAVSFLIPQKTSSSFYKALNGTVQYQFQSYSFGINYERVDPGYRTLGAYYFNNDLENITLIHQSSWLNSKLNLNVRFGQQKNNLARTELNSMQRLSLAVSLNYQITPRLVSQINFSDFNTYVNFRPLVEVLNQSSPYDNLDTLNYHQLARQASSNISVVLNESQELRQNLNFNFSFQETTDGRGEDQYNGSQFYNLNSAYLVVFGESGWALNVAGNLNYSRSYSDQFIFGPSGSLRRKFLENKLTTYFTAAYNQSKIDGRTSNKIYNLRTGGAYALNSHQFSLNLTAIDRINPNKEVGSRYKELVVEIGYRYTFSTP